MANKNLLLFLVTLLLLSIFATCQSSSSIVKSKKANENLLIKFNDKKFILKWDSLIVKLKVINNGREKIILPKKLNSRFLFEFNDKKIYRISPDIQETFSATIKYSSKEDSLNYINNNCYLDNEYFSVIYPGEEHIVTINLNKLYFGFRMFEEYKMKAILDLPNELKYTCPLIWTGQSFSDSIKLLIIP